MIDNGFSKEELEIYLREVCKYFSKMTKKSDASAEIILVGGASILLNYKFRQKTTDTDADYMESSELKIAIKKVSELYSLPDEWLNDDFKKTASYSPKIRQYSKHYKSYYGVEIRTIKDEYLIAMKLKSNRSYKHDYSDIVGVLMSNSHITLELIKQAAVNLYGSIDMIEDEAWQMLEHILEYDNKEALYHDTTKEESLNASALILAEENYPDDVKTENSDEFIQHFRKQLADMDGALTPSSSGSNLGKKI